MGACEEQPQPFVGDVGTRDLLTEAAGMVVMIARSQFVLDPQPGEMTGAHLIGAEAVDRTVLRRGHQPRLGSGGHTAAGPRLDRAEHGIVEGLLGEVEIAESIGQRREQPPTILLADGAEDPDGRLGVGVHQ
jgi:hypothetical protein